MGGWSVIHANARTRKQIDIVCLDFLVLWNAADAGCRARRWQMSRCESNGKLQLALRDRIAKSTTPAALDIILSTYKHDHRQTVKLNLCDRTTHRSYPATRPGPRLRTRTQCMSATAPTASSSLSEDALGSASARSNLLCAARASGDSTLTARSMFAGPASGYPGSLSPRCSLMRGFTSRRGAPAGRRNGWTT